MKKTQFLSPAVVLAGVLGVVVSQGLVSTACYASDSSAPPVKSSKSAGTAAEISKASSYHVMHLSAALKAIDAALKFIESGDTKAALKELAKARMLVSSTRKTIGKGATRKFANAKCPLMGSPIIPGKVSDKLIRVHGDKLIAFCCAGCPGQWDALSDSAKETKLAKVWPDKKDHKPERTKTKHEMPEKHKGGHDDHMQH